MATYTKYKNLENPSTDERYNIGVANKNNNVIDSEFHKLDIKNQKQDELIDTLATNELLNKHTSSKNNPHEITKEQIGLGHVDNTFDIDKPVSTAQQDALDLALFTHNTSNSAHSDIRILISELTTRLNALADSDDTTLDQLSEIVAYIKNNKGLIDSITTSKINISDIIDDLSSNDINKPLSAKQGKILKDLLTTLMNSIPTKTSDLTNDSGFATTDTWQANTKDREGYVTPGNGQLNKVWKTDTNGNPGWRNETIILGSIIDGVADECLQSLGITAEDTVQEIFLKLPLGISIVSNNAHYDPYTESLPIRAQRGQLIYYKTTTRGYIEAQFFDNNLLYVASVLDGVVNSFNKVSLNDNSSSIIYSDTEPSSFAHVG